MSRISSSVGLVSGIPIADTVAKLMEVAATPRNILKTRTDGLKQQQLALDTMGSRLLGFQFAVNKLKSTGIYTTRDVTSSRPDSLTASAPASGTPNVGTYQVRPVRAASSQQLISQRFETAAGALGSGAFSFGFSEPVDKGVLLEELNGGAGVQRGKIRLTDRSGASTTIDLSFARTVDDVVQAINSSSDVSVVAATSGDSFTLTDNSGGTGNLRVQEVGSGTTAASLGLSSVNVAADQATGADVLRLHAGTRLSSLNDGNGVEVSKEGVADLEVTLRDGTQLNIDLHDVRTIGDVLEQINATDSDKLKAAISAAGRRIELTDLTAGGGAFSVESGVASTTAEDLGIAANVGGAGTLTGDRLISGLQDSLLSRLRGGEGVGELGDISITDRNGDVTLVDLSSAETLDDVVDLLNSAGGAFTASINSARNGLQITDASGGSGDLIIASTDATDTAEALGIVIEDAVGTVNSGALGRQSISRATLLSSLNGGKGVTLGDIRITDSAGGNATADLDSSTSPAKTVGDVIDAINALANGVEARINDAGDGILIVDTAGGTSKLGVVDRSGNISATLNLTGASKTVEIDGDPTQVIDGSRTFAIDLDDLDLDAAAIPLSSLRNGQGVSRGDFTITDSAGESLGVDFNGADAGVSTIGQMIELINDKAVEGNVSVRARINDAGTGILLEDSARGTGKLTVTDTNSATAADLKLTGTVTTANGKQTINGAGAFSISASAATGLDAVAARINDLDAGVTATTFFDGLGYRLSLSVDATGSANQLLVDAADSGFEFEETSRAEDALLLYGNFANPGAGVLLSSSDGQFASAIGGVDVTVKEASDTPVTIKVGKTSSSLVEAVQDLVESYNSLRTDLGKLTKFDAEALTTGLLFGSNEALQIDQRLSLALTSRYAGTESFQLLSQIGVSINDDGTLSLDSAKLQTAADKDPDGLEKFLSDSQNGVAVKLGAVIDRLAGTENSLLASRSDALTASIEANEDRLAKFETQLERQEERLFLQFTQLETVIAKFQTSLSAIQSIQALPALGS
jgi:flagellar hook-associated protein 2